VDSFHLNPLAGDLKSIFNGFERKAFTTPRLIHFTADLKSILDVPMRKRTFDIDFSLTRHATTEVT